VHFWIDATGTTSATYGFRVLSADGVTRDVNLGLLLSLEQ